MDFSFRARALGKMLWCYRLFKVLYFSAGSSRTSAIGGHLHRVWLELYLKGGGRFGNPEARSLGGTFESDYKMAASEIKVSARSRRSYKKGDFEQSINVIIDCN